LEVFFLLIHNFQSARTWETTLLWASTPVVGFADWELTPLFHWSFLPTFTQVNFLFALTALRPSFVHLKISFYFILMQKFINILSIDFIWCSLSIMLTLCFLKNLVVHKSLSINVLVFFFQSL
jgi:hypothetical protein